MAVTLSFPTLQHLSILSISKKIFDNKLGPKVDWNNYEYVEDFTKEIVQKLPLPLSLEPVVFDVMSGINHQISKWLKCSGKIPTEGLKLAFDVHGSINEQKVLGSYFEAKRADRGSIESLIKMLTIACKYQLLPEIENVLRRIMALTEEGIGMRLQGPKHKIVSERLVLTYKLFHSSSSKSTYKVLISLKKILRTLPYVTVQNKSIVISFNPTTLCMSFFKEYWCLLDPSRGMPYIREVLFSNETYVKTGMIAGLLKFLSFEDQRALFDLLNRRRYSYAHSELCFLLLCLLEWPLTQIFIETLEIVCQNLMLNDFYRLFTEIVSRISKLSGVLYRNLLSEFWHNIPVLIKQEFCASFYSHTGAFPIYMKELSYKDSSIHCTIMNDLKSVTQAN